MTDGNVPRDRPRLSIGDVTVAENAGRAEFTVTLSHRSNEVVTVAYATDGRDGRGGCGLHVGDERDADIFRPEADDEDDLGAGCVDDTTDEGERDVHGDAEHTER